MHAFRDCSNAMQVWANKVPSNFLNDFLQAELTYRVNLNLGSKGDEAKDWREYWVVVCHCLWTQRNKEEHDEYFSRPFNTGQHVRSLVKSYESSKFQNDVVSKVGKAMELIAWKPPKNNWAKLNTDRACKDIYNACCGGVIQDSRGDLIGSFTKKSWEM